MYICLYERFRRISRNRVLDFNFGMNRVTQIVEKKRKKRGVDEQRLLYAVLEAKLQQCKKKKREIGKGRLAGNLGPEERFAKRPTNLKKKKERDCWRQ